MICRPIAIRLGAFAAVCAVAACGSDAADSTSTDADASSGVDAIFDGSGGSGETTPIELVEAASPPDGFDPADVTHQPREGIWTYRRGAIESNSCGDLAWGDGDTPFRVAYSADGAFVIEQDEPWGSFVCFVLGDRFSCPDRGEGEVPLERADVVVRYRVAVEGDVIDPETLQGVQSADVDCVGEACALAPAVLGVEFPCSWVIPFEATFVSASP